MVADPGVERADAADRRVLRVAAGGTASELPFRWIFYQVADREGRQASLVFTVEEKFVERFGNADEKLLNSLRIGE